MRYRICVTCITLDIRLRLWTWVCSSGILNFGMSNQLGSLAIRCFGIASSASARVLGLRSWPLDLRSVRIFGHGLGFVCVLGSAASRVSRLCVVLVLCSARLVALVLCVSVSGLGLGSSCASGCLLLWIL